MKLSHLRVFILVILSLFSATAGLSATVPTHPDMAHCGFTGTARLADGASLRIRLALNDAAKTTGLSGMRLNWTSQPTVKEIEQCMADAWKQDDSGANQ